MQRSLKVIYLYFQGPFSLTKFSPEHCLQMKAFEPPYLHFDLVACGANIFAHCHHLWNAFTLILTAPPPAMPSCFQSLGTVMAVNASMCSLSKEWPYEDQFSAGINRPEEARHYFRHPCEFHHPLARVSVSFSSKVLHDQLESVVFRPPSLKIRLVQSKATSLKSRY